MGDTMVNDKKVLVAMSGGVDSSVAAYMLKEAGYECYGCTMKLHDSMSCCDEEDIRDARGVAESLNIPFSVVDYSKGFYENVICRFISGYEHGITPNPCIECNKYMKFLSLYEQAASLGCDYIATGHYVRVEYRDGRYYLLKAADESKDQSYVLYSLTQAQLAHTLFPLGSLSKDEIRSRARGIELVNADKPDSQDICFVPGGDYASVIKQYTGRGYEPGDFVDKNGQVLGRHKGIIHYTIGQRKGLGIAYSEPLYVLNIDVSGNKVVLGSNDDLMSTEVYVEQMNWILGEIPTKAFRCSAKLRYRHREQPATVYPEEGGCIRIVFDEPQRAVTPGQAAVLYDGEIVLGGGTISRI